MNKGFGNSGEGAYALLVKRGSLGNLNTPVTWAGPCRDWHLQVTGRPSCKGPFATVWIVLCLSQSPLCLASVCTKCALQT